MFGFGDDSGQMPPLARSLIGGLGAATMTTLLVLPCVFSLVQARTGRGDASLYLPEEAA